MMQDVSEMAGNLKAELLEIRDDARVGRITEEEALRRIRVIRTCAARARNHRPEVANDRLQVSCV